MLLSNMNYKVFTQVFFGVLGFALLTGCSVTENKNTEISANMATNPNSDLEDLIFDNGFSSPEYLESVRSAVLDIQLREAVEVAVEKKTPESCDRIPDEYLRKNCRNTMFETKAITENDEQWCKEIADSTSRIGCLDKMANLQAISEGNEKICDRISDEKLKKDCGISAILSSAINNLDPATCRRLEDIDTRDFCLQEVQQKAENN